MEIEEKWPRRLFVAVDIPGQIKAALVDGPGHPWPGRAVPAENMHLTLRFLGRTEEVGYDRLLAALSAIAHPPFHLQLTGLGTFPNPRRATVLWVGMDQGATDLIELAGEVEGAALTAGFAAEERPFHPHLTLSRIRPHQDVTAVLAQPLPVGLRFKVNDFALFESHLGRGGARYEVLERFVLTQD